MTGELSGDESRTSVLADQAGPGSQERMQSLVRPGAAPLRSEAACRLPTNPCCPSRLPVRSRAVPSLTATLQAAARAEFEPLSLPPTAPWGSARRSTHGQKTPLSCGPHLHQVTLPSPLQVTAKGGGTGASPSHGQRRVRAKSQAGGGGPQGPGESGGPGGRRRGRGSAGGAAGAPGEGGDGGIESADDDPWASLPGKDVPSASLSKQEQIRAEASRLREEEDARLFEQVGVCPQGE